MTDNNKVLVSKKRTVHSYSWLWHGSHNLLQRSKDEPKGAYWLWMSSLVFSAFTFEAYLNHIGEKLFKTWDALEVLSPSKKLDVICEKLEIALSSSKRPMQTVQELFKFRNDIAHAKTTTLEEKPVLREVDEHLDNFLGEKLLTTVEKYCTEKNAKRVREDVEKIMRLIHDTAQPENDPLFFFGLGQHSASLVQDS